MIHVYPSPSSDKFWVMACSPGGLYAHGRREDVIEIAKVESRTRGLPLKIWAGGDADDRPFTLKEIADAACEIHGIDFSTLIGTTRLPAHVSARATFAGACRRLTTKSYPEIGRFAGRPLHSTMYECARRFARMDDVVQDRLVGRVTDIIREKRIKEQREKGGQV